MGLTITEKILAKASGKKIVAPGEIIRARPCFSTSNDFYTYPHWADRLDRMGVKRLYAPERIAVVADHFCPATNVVWACHHQGLRKWVERFGKRRRPHPTLYPGLRPEQGPGLRLESGLQQDFGKAKDEDFVFLSQGNPWGQSFFS